MTDLSGKWYLDGIDIFSAYSVFMEEGSAEFLKFPPKKQSIEHDWTDADGIDVDLTSVFMGQREGTLNMAIIATNSEDFFIKQQNFIAHWFRPDLRRLEIASHGLRSYYIFYKECTSYNTVKALTGQLTGKFAYRFSLAIVEPKPTINNSNVFLVDDQGRFLIT